MRDLTSYFENRNIDYQKLLEYGFILANDLYYFKIDLYHFPFQVVVEIGKNRKISKVIDLETHDEYLLVDVVSSTGEFIGKVKEEYENILNDIVKKCSTSNVFKSSQAKDVICYIKEKYGDDLEFLWEKSPTSAIWRNQKNSKWYAVLLVLNESKLGLNLDKIVEIIDLKYPKDRINEVIDHYQVFGGYHMNKKSWITVKLDSSMDIVEIYELIDTSYQLSLEK